MSKLKLKSTLPETFKISKSIIGVGMMEFDSMKVKSEDYIKWSKIGFGDLFEEAAIILDEPSESEADTKEVIQALAKVLEEKPKTVRKKKTSK